MGLEREGLGWEWLPKMGLDPKIAVVVMERFHRCSLNLMLLLLPQRSAVSPRKVFSRILGNLKWEKTALGRLE